MKVNNNRYHKVKCLVKRCLPVCLIVFLPLHATAQDVNALYTQAVQQKIALEEQNEQLSKRNQQLRKEAQRLESDLEDLRDDETKQQRKLNNLRQKEQDSKLPALLERRQQLTESIAASKASIEALQHELDSLVEADRQLRGQREQLETAKEAMVQQLIEKHQPLLQRPFRELTANDITAALGELSRINDHDEVRTLIEQLEHLKQNLDAYGLVGQVLNSPYNAPDVQRAAATLQSLTDVNAAQREEISHAAQQLRDFEPALAAFRQLITNLNSRGAGSNGYSNSDLNDDLSIFHAENVEQKVNNIPYLKKSYAIYINELKINPKRHPAIEREIMNE